MNHLQTSKHVPPLPPLAGYGGGSNLRVDVHDPYILVALRGTCLRAKFRKQDAPWLAMDEYEEDSEASITFKEFRTLAWQAANERARDLGWVRSCDELHEAVKRAGSAA